MTLAELLAMLTALATLDADQLAQLQTDLAAAAQERLEADPTDEVLAELDSIGEALASIRTEIETRETDLAERIARRDAAAARIAEATAGPEDEIEDEGDGIELPPDTDAGVAAEVEPAPDVPAPVAASVVPPVAAVPSAAPVVTRVAARRPASTQPRRPVTASAVLPDNIEDWGLHASAGSQDLVPGSRIRTLEELGTLFASAITAGEGININGELKTKLAYGGSRNLRETYADDRILGSDPYANEDKIQRVTSPQAIAAAGGICAPPLVRYDLPILAGSEARPVRDQLATRFGADRGAVTTLSAPVIEDAAGGIGTWTNTQDITPGGATKTCMELNCPDPSTSTIQAITSCLTLGNFRARFFGEQIQAFITLLAVNQARTAETIAINKIGAGSTQVNTGQVLGTARDVLAALDRAIASLRNRHRFQSGQMPLRFGAPDWLHDMIRVDLARQMPVGTVAETLAVADGEIESFFRARNVNVAWLLEGESGQNFAKQLDGPLGGWPTNVVTYLFPEGTWLFLDGGQLDLGIVRDSVLNAVNKFQIFSETFETVHKHGVESWRISMDVCPDGSASALIDIDPCATGS